MYWTQHINLPSHLLKKGERVKWIVMAIDKETRRIFLSMKHLERSAMTRTANLYLFAKAGRWNCPDPRGDCDGDGTPDIKDAPSRGYGK